MAAPNTRSWSARENALEKDCQLIVCGQVEVSNLSKEPQLAETGSRDPKVLGLTLTIADAGGSGGEMVVWKGASHTVAVTHDQYASVVIRWEDSVIERLDVTDDREYGAHMDKQAKANAVAAKKIKPPVGKKPAAKKPGAKKPAPKKARPAPTKPAPAKKAPAKKAAKKKAPKKAAAKKAAPKKTAKKKAPAKKTKKSAKKSGLSRFVKKLVKKFTPSKKKKSKKRR